MGFESFTTSVRPGVAHPRFARVTRCSTAPFRGLLAGITLACAITGGLSSHVAFGQAPSSNSDFTYQGRIELGGVPYSGDLIVRAGLFDGPTSSVAVAPTVEQVVTVSDGLLTFPLDFGSVEAASGPRFVEIAVRQPSETVFTVLTPRQLLAGVPTAGTASRALGIDLINSGARPSYEIAASQNDGSVSFAATRHWQAFNVPNGGRITLLTLTRRGSPLATTARVRIYAGNTPSGQLLHEQNTGIPAGGEITIPLAPLGLELIGGQIYTWELDTPVQITLARSSLDTTPALPSSILGADYAFRVYTGDVAAATFRATRVGVGVAAPTADFHVAGSSELSTARIDSGNATGTWLNMGNSSSSGRTWSLVSTGAQSLEGTGKFVIRSVGSSANLVMDGNGVGVGVSAPQTRLHVSSGSDASLAGGGSIQMGSSTNTNVVMDDNEIMARNNGAPADLALNADGGRVGIGSSPFAADFHINRTGDASLATGGLFQIGGGGINLIMDANEIQARVGTAASDLVFNAEGGSVGVGFGPYAASFHVTRGGNIFNNESPFLRLGTTNSSNLAFDANEIQALNNNAVATLALNLRGGAVEIGNLASITLSNVLLINGNAAKPGGGLWAALSDQRAKADIAPMNGTLDRLLSLHGYTFRYTDQALAQGGALPGTQVGLMAQEVQRVFPDWVYTDHLGRLNVAERGITALMVEALRDLRAEKDRADADARARLDDAAARIRALEAQNALLLERLERLERHQQAETVTNSRR